MPLPSRPAILMLAALLGAAGIAVAAPQQHRGRAAIHEGVRARGDQDARQDARQPPPQQRPDWIQPQPARRSEDALSDSVRRVERRTRGQVLSAERVPYDGRNINRIKFVDDRGRVHVYMDDPQQPARHPAQDDGHDPAPTRDNDD
jgi:hypothetical protein